MAERDRVLDLVAIFRWRLYASFNIRTTTILGGGTPSSSTVQVVMTPIQSVERALGVLKSFTEISPYLTAQQIASRVEVPRPSVYRFLKTLVANGFLIEVGDGDQRRYAIGPAVLELSRLAFGQAELRRCAQPVMQLMAEKTGDSVYLSVRQGAQAVCVENIDATTPLRYGGRIGNAYPLYAGSPKVILAFLDPDLRDHLISKMTFKAITRATITSRSELQRRLALIQQRGYEISRSEMFPGTCAIGAPIFDDAGIAVAVLSVGAPQDRINVKNQTELARLIIAGAKEVTLRYRRQLSNDLKSAVRAQPDHAAIRAPGARSIEHRNKRLAT